MQPFETLEQRWAEFNYVPTENMVACSSGTAALHLALESLSLPPGSQVAIPDYTMIACARAVTLAGLEPVLIGCTDRLLMDLDALDEALSREPIRAVMAVHIYGRLVNMGEVHILAEKYGGGYIDVIEDMAEAHGLVPHPNTYAACWSFYKNKVVAGEEGGAVYFMDERYANPARELRCIGFTKEHNYLHTPRGHNYRMANLLAIPILDSLGRYDENLNERRRLETRYDGLCPESYQSSPRDVPWVYDLRIPSLDPSIQTRIVTRLNTLGIAARYGFKPMRDQREYRGVRYYGNQLSRRYAGQIIYLPLTPGLVTDEQVDLAMKVIRDELGYPALPSPA